MPAPSEHPVARHLLPMTAEVGPSGSLVVGGVDLVELADEHGTPLFVYDELHLRRRCGEALEVFDEGTAYATKAFLCKAMARLAVEEGLRLDVATGGELHVALAAGIAGQDLVLHGNNKSGEELALAIGAGVGRIVVDSFDEIDRIDRLMSETTQQAGRQTTQQAGWQIGRPERLRVLVRVTPGVEAHTHEFVRTGQEDSKFGFSIASGAAHEAVSRISATQTMDLVGIHAHIGSQVFDVGSFAEAAEVIAPFFVPLGLPEICVGGGLGVAYLSSETAPSIGEWARVVKESFSRNGVGAGVRITAEPGRSIVADACLTLYRVGTMKEIPSVRTYVAVDGGMSDNPRPVLYGSGYEAFLVREPAAPRPLPVRVVGKHCESGDVLVSDARLPSDVKVGDLLATPVTGAYGYSMASNYNKVPRPAVVFVADGTARVVVRREDFDDLVRLDV